MAAAFPPATNAGMAAAKKGAMPPRYLPTPGLRFLAVPFRLIFWICVLYESIGYLYLRQRYALMVFLLV